MRRLSLALLVMSLAGAAAAGQEEVFEKAFSMEGVSRISVQNVNGRIEVSAWDRPYLKVRAVKTVSGGFSSSEEILQQTEIRVSKRGDEIRLETVNPHRHHLFGFLDWGHNNARVDYELHVPAVTSVRLETTNGQVQSTGIEGPVACDVVNGSIELSECAGPVRATSVNGALRIAFRGPLKKSELETVNGSVEVAFDKSSSVKYSLQTVNGRIEGDIDLTVEGKYGPKEARGSYNGGTESLNCETVNGSIRLKTR
jgi:hypothetical protein